MSSYLRVYHYYQLIATLCVHIFANYYFKINSCHAIRLSDAETLRRKLSFQVTTVACLSSLLQPLLVVQILVAAVDLTVQHGIYHLSAELTQSEYVGSVQRHVVHCI